MTDLQDAPAENEEVPVSDNISEGSAELPPARGEEEFDDSVLPAADISSFLETSVITEEDPLAAAEQHYLVHPPPKAKFAPRLGWTRKIRGMGPKLLKFGLIF